MLNAAFFLEKCCCCKSMFQLKQLYAVIITVGFSQYEPIVSSILSFSAISDTGNIDFAFRIFSSLHNPTLSNWNSIIRGYSRSRNPNKSISVFVEMLRAGVYPDHLTYPFLAKACARLLEVGIGAAVHARVVKNGNEVDRFIGNSLLHMYASCGDILYARQVFDGMPVQNLVSWNSMVDGYAKCGRVTLAREVFDLMPQRDVVSWSSLIDGYVKSGEYEEAMAVFEEMQAGSCKANEVTMVSVLCACAHLGALDQGKKMHCYIMDNRLSMNLALHTSLVDMYAKCGAIEEALVIFRGVPAHQTDVLLWNAIIGGLATHGLVTDSLELFAEMQRFGIVPDEITYLCLLSACAHGGLVKEAWYFFDCVGKHGRAPKSEHYACMVDVLARAGRVAEAYQFLCQMPMEPTPSMLGALLNGCINHGKLDLAEMVGKKLVELQPNDNGRYVGLSNVFAIKKRWDEARRTREAMERRGVKKCAGFSLLEMSGELHRFIAHDKTHSRSDQIYMMLSLVTDQMKHHGVNTKSRNLN